MKKTGIDFILLQMIWVIAFVVFYVFGLDNVWVAFAPTIIILTILIIAYIYVFIKSIIK